MPRMTMDLNVRDTNELAGVQAGDVVTFRLLADDATHWIDNLRVVGRVHAPEDEGIDPEEAAFTLLPVRELNPGDLAPDVEFLDENGRVQRFSRLAGRAVAFSFIFTRCPLPDFCPLMNRSFAEARRLLRADSKAPTNWFFLSLSFDPEFDRPPVLRAYARGYRGADEDRWRFAVLGTNAIARLAPALDLRLIREQGSISHNLRTVVLDPQGRIHRQFDGNRWTARDLADALIEAAGKVKHTNP